MVLRHAVMASFGGSQGRIDAGWVNKIEFILSLYNNILGQECPKECTTSIPLPHSQCGEVGRVCNFRQRSCCGQEFWSLAATCNEKMKWVVNRNLTTCDYGSRVNFIVRLYMKCFQINPVREENQFLQDKQKLEENLSKSSRCMMLTLLNTVSISMIPTMQ